MIKKLRLTYLFSILLGFILIVFLFKSFLLNLNNSILYNQGDPALNLYFLKWGADYILGNVSGNSIFNLPVAYPFQNSLAMSDNLFGNQIIFLPLYLIIDNPLLVFNIWIIITMIMNYLFMYIYFRQSKLINSNFYLANIGATIFTFSLPSFDLLGGHLQLLLLYFIPISLLLLEKAMTSLKIKYFIFFGLAVSFQFYLGIQTGFILLILLIFILPVYLYYLVRWQL